MSFIDNLGKMAGEALAGANPAEAVTAASDHVQSTDPNQLAQHLTQSLGTMDTSNVVALGQHLLETFTNHASYSGDGNQAAQEAGTSATAVASGDPNAVAALIDYARANPQVLQTAASAFVQRNPGAIAQLAPGLLEGILGRLQRH